MDTSPRVRGASPRPGGFSIACRLLCTGLVALPLINYASTMLAGGDGSAAEFLLSLLLALVAGLTLIANSLFCLFRYHKVQSFWIGCVFILVGAIGLIEAVYFLPKFRM